MDLKSFLSAHLHRKFPARVGAAVSGGADSVALLDALISVEGVTVIVLHLDHGLRPDSGNDRKFVETLAQSYGVECVSEKAEDLDGSEEAARDARYRFLARSSRKLKLAAVCTAHTADDQAETVLFRFLRGTGLRGLCGIPAARRDGDVLYLRPFLDVRREEIMRRLDSKQLSWREDSSNLSPAFARNRIRRQIIPFLREHINPSLTDTLLRTAEILRADNEIIENLVAAELSQAKFSEGKARIALAALSNPLRRRVIREILTRIGAPSSEETVNLVDRAVESKKTVRLSNAFIAQIDRKEIVLGRLLEKSGQTVLVENGDTVIPSLGLLVRTSSEPPGVIPIRQNAMTAMFDADSVNGEMFIRTREEGDRLRPFGMTGTKKIHDIFIDQKIPLIERDRYPIVCDASGILWAPGLIQDERTRVTSATRRVLKIEIVRAPENQSNKDNEVA